MPKYSGFDPIESHSVVTSETSIGGTSHANTVHTKLYLPFNNDVNDDSPLSQTITNRGSMTVDSTYTKFGSNALKSKTSGSLKIHNSSSTDLDGPFTVEFFLYVVTHAENKSVYTHNEMNSSYQGFLFWFGGGGILRSYGSSNGSSWNIFHGSSAHFGTISTDTWHHVALTYDGTTYRGYLNGTLKWSQTSSTTIPTGGDHYIFARNDIGQYVPTTGSQYMDDFRITKGKALYTDSTYTVPTSALGILQDHPVSIYLPFDSDINDDSSYGHTVTASGSATISSTQSKFGGNSLSLNGTNQYLTVSNDPAFQFGSDDFTVEAWVYQTAAAGSDPSDRHAIVSRMASSSNRSWNIGTKLVSGEQRLQFGFTADGSSSSEYTFECDVTINTWHHIAIVRSGSDLYGFLNGKLLSSSIAGVGALGSQTIYAGTSDLAVGYRGLSTQYFEGYIDDLRIIKGVARYTKSFVPSSQAVGATLTGANETNTTTDFTTLYLPFDSDIQDDSAKAHSMTATGDAAISSAQSKFGGYSLATDGTGDRLEFTYDTNSYFGTDDFTVEAWVWITAYSGSYFTVVSLGQPGATGSYQPKFLLNVEGSGNKVRSIIAGSYINHSDAISGSFPTGEWVHLAATRENGIYRTFINGVLNGSTTNSSDVTSDSGTSTIGGASYGGGSGTAYSNNGYIDDLRILKGYAKYTGDFLPPTSAVSASVSETVNDLTVLYLPFDTTVTSGSSAASSLYLPFDTGYGTDDQSSYGHTVTVSGNATTDNPVTPVTGYNGAASRSGYFDGNGDYLTVANHSSLVFGSDDFTVEGFFYAQSVGSDGLIGMWEDNQRQWLISFAGGRLYAAYSTNGTSATSLNSGVTVSTGQTYHFAFTRQGSTFRLFVDGTLKATSTYSGSLFNTSGALHVGSNGDNLGSLEFNGYLDDLRVIKGTAIYTENFSVPTAAVGPTGTPITTSGGFEDQARNHGVVKNGDVRLSTTVKKFGISSAYFDGTGDYLSLTYGYQESSDDFSYTDDDFTIEAWVYLTSYNTDRSIIISRDAEQTQKRGWRFAIESNGKLNFTYTADGSSRISTSTNGTISLNTWTNVAFTRQGDVGRFFINGTVDSITRDFNGDSIYDPAVSEVLVGARDFGSADNFSGYIDDLRVIKGLARYTASYTAPTSAVGSELTESTTAIITDTKALSSTWTMTNDGSSPRTFIDMRSDNTWANNEHLQSQSSHRWNPANSGEGPGTTATGGSIATPGNGYRYHVFTSPGTFELSAIDGGSPSLAVEYLVVAGGGGGAANRAGGGGAGGLRTNEDGNPKAGAAMNIATGSFPVVVGTGGAGGDFTPGVITFGDNGTVSSFNSIESAGGGTSRSSGGSGGGGHSAPPYAAGSGNTPPVSPPQGNDGGAGHYPHGGGGGGGAGAAGSAGNPNAGDGGAGHAMPSFSGPILSPVIPGAMATAIGPTGLYAGGGGGGGSGAGPGVAGAGGPGGGGNGGNASVPPSSYNPNSGVYGPGGADAVDGTGGGGGGGGNAPGNNPWMQPAGDGGNGIVIIKYAY